MNILLINAPLEKRETYKSFSPPLGILYLAAVLEKNGFEVEIIDGDQENNCFEAINLKISNNKPDIVGISAMTPTFLNAVLTAQQIKQLNPDSLLVLGGYHPTFNAERILKKYSFIDICVRGEGEYSFLEIAKGIPLRNIAGITYREGDLIRTNPTRPSIADLDELPFPARHLIKKYDYKYSESFNWNDPRRYRLSELKRYTSIATSRGCPFKCLFCANTAFSSNKFRGRSAENVAAEIEQVVKDGSNRFFFVDDNFTANPTRAIKICKYIKDLNANIKWFCMGRADTASDELYLEMAKSGCILILFGVESGSQRILDYYNKNTKVAQIKNALKLARKYRIDIFASLIVGAPIESDADIEETKKLVVGEDIDFLEVSKLAINSGTPLWKKAVSENKINEEKDWEKLLFVYDVFKEISALNIRKWARKINHAFYLRPDYLAKQIWRTFNAHKNIIN